MGTYLGQIWCSIHILYIPSNIVLAADNIIVDFIFRSIQLMVDLKVEYI